MARHPALPALLLAALVAVSPAAAQDVPPAGAPEPVAPGELAPAESAPGEAAPLTPAEREAPPEMPPLAPDEVARIGTLAVLHDTDFNRYLATVYTRLPEGDAALRQLLGEALIGADAAAAGIVATDADVDAALAALDEQSRAAGGKGFADSVQAGVNMTQIRAAVALLVLHERLLRASAGLPPDAPITPQQMAEWLDARIAAAQWEPAALDDPLAATYTGGSLTKVAVGERLQSLLTPDALSGVLTEMIGVLLVRARANQLGVDLTTAAATREILDRDAALRAQAGTGDVTYQEFVEQVQKRTLPELLTSDRFSTEVLVRLLAEQAVSDDKAREFWEQNKEAFRIASKGKLGPDADWEAARPTVWRELRQRTYRALFEPGRIARRF